MKRTHLLNLYSQDAENYPNGNGDISRFSVRIYDIINKAPDERAFVTVRYAEMPRLFTQINDTNNSFGIVSVSGAVVAALTLPDGSFTGNQLAEVLETLINDEVGAGAVDVQYGANNGSFLVTQTGVDDVSIRFNVANSAAGLFGFNEAVYNMTNQNDTVASQNVGQLAPQNTLALNTNLNLHNSYSSATSGRSSVIEFFPVANYTQLSFANTNTVFRSELKNDTIQNIELWLTDGRGKDVIIDPTQHWMVSLLIQIEPMKN